MKTTNKLLAAVLSAAMVLSMTACNNSSNPSGGGTDNNIGDGTTATTTSASFAEATAPQIDESAETGIIKYLTYENNFETASADMLTLFKERYGGEVEVEATATSLNYAEMLGTKIATGDSPDIIRYEGWVFPHGASFNMFTPLDSYIDLDSDLWSEMKPTAEQYAYNGKHFYVPYLNKTSFALNYNNRVLEENGIPDPIKMVQDGTWTWSAFEELLKQWQNIDPVNHIAYNGVGALAFSYTTGKKIIEVKDGNIYNNLKDADIVRCMQWLEGLRKQGLVGATAEQVANGKVSGYIDPGEAFKDGQLLFLGMEPTWSYPAAKESLDGAGIPNEMKFIPFPRDDASDVYYQATDSFGYLVPAGAPNVKGAIDWITLLRTEQADPENIANERAKMTDDSPSYYPKCANPDCGDTSENADDKGRHMFTVEENELGVDTCPVCGTPRKEKYKAVWTDEQYDMYKDMLDGTKYTLLYDNLYGFSVDFKNLFVDGTDHLLDGLVFGDISYTNEMESIYGVVEGYLQPYRDRMAADARGEEITTTPPAED